MSTLTTSPYAHSSPVKHNPNPHPYPIKTTSTALLTRSNTSPHASQSAGRHYYVPPASPSRSDSTRSEAGSVPTGSSKGGHRYSRSLTSNLPASLPVPPSPTRSLNSLDLDLDCDQRTPPPRLVYRSDSIICSSDLPPTPYELPSNPKTWSCAELSIYLGTALRSQSGA